MTPEKENFTYDLEKYDGYCPFHAYRLTKTGICTICYLDEVYAYSGDPISRMCDQIEKDRSQAKDCMKYYFLTFTWNPNWNLSFMPDAIKKSLDRTNIQLLKAAIEHIDSNIHVHAYINFTGKGKLQKANFKSYVNRVGNIDIKKVRKDNGVSTYLDKEDAYYSVSDLIDGLQEAIEQRLL